MKLKVMCLGIIISMSFLLLGCTQILKGKNDNKDIQKYINSDVKTLSTLQEDYKLTSRDYSIVSDGIDEDYKELNGNKNVLDIYSKDGANEPILYNANFKSGNFRVILIKPNGEAVDIVKNNGDGSVTVKIPSGRSIIKLIGSNATGRLKISIPSTSVANLKDIGNINKDGEFKIYKDHGTKGNNFSMVIYRINVVNKKIDKVAKIELKGKIVDGKVATTFDNDGWGNSGTAEINLYPKLTATIKIKNKTFKSAEWGIMEGTFTEQNSDLPDFAKGL